MVLASADIIDAILDSGKLIHYGGVVIVIAIIFAETGLFFGFIFPGDALLFSAGVLTSSEELEVNIFLLLFAVTFAAVGGNITGYYTGHILGKRLFKKEDSTFFKKSHLEKAKQFYRKYGGGSIVVGRFLPIVRTFVPMVSGAINVEIRKFTFYNVMGAFFWVWTFILAGYFLGKKFPGILNHLELFILGFFVITTLVLIRGYLKLKNEKKRTAK